MEKTRGIRADRARAGWWLLAGVLASVGCSAGKASTPPLAGSLTGPSTLGTSVQLLVNPDIMFADGQSTSTILVRVSDSNGAPASNQVVYLLTGDDNEQVVNIGRLSAAVVTTGADGSARATFTAPLAKDFSANERVTIFARLAGTNAQTIGPGIGQFTAPYAKILLVSVDQRTWPPGGSHPTCAMMTDPRWGPWYTGENIHFTTRSTPYSADAPIIQYLWRFGDNETKFYYGPDQWHVFKHPGQYEIFQSVLDSNGEVDSCLFVHDGEPYMTVQAP
jgi:hypothetical protein